MKKEISPAAATVIVAIIAIVLLGIGWKLFLAPPAENLPAPPGERPPLLNLPGGNSPANDPTTRSKPTAPK